MWDLSRAPMCLATENTLWFALRSDPAVLERVHLGHSEFWQDSVALLPASHRRREFTHRSAPLSTMAG